MGFIVTVNSDLFNIDYIRRSLIRIQLNFTASYCHTKFRFCYLDHDTLKQ